MGNLLLLGDALVGVGKFLPDVAEVLSREGLRHDEKLRRYVVLGFVYLRTGIDPWLVRLLLVLDTR